MSNLAGQNIGPYRVIEQLGQGGMATVYKAYQPSMDRYVAIKVLPRYFASDPTFVGRFEQEAKVVARLEHARILPIYDYGEDDGVTYIVMRYLNAGTLADRLAEGPVPLQETARIIRQVAEGLDYAHQHGVIHRDIKPANIMLDASNDVYITDFGISKLVEGTAQFTGSGIVGTPAYVSPEQGLGQPIDYRSDIYSLGVVLYQMAVGQVPYHAETPMAVVIKHIYDPLPLPRERNPEVPEAVERIILKAMAKKPDDRFQSCGEMADVLMAAAGGRYDKAYELETEHPHPTMPLHAPAPAGAAETAPSPLPDAGDADTLMMQDRTVSASTPGAVAVPELDTSPLPAAPARKPRLGLALGLIAGVIVVGLVALLLALSGRLGQRRGGEASATPPVEKPEGEPLYAGLVLPGEALCPEGTEPVGEFNFTEGAIPVDLGDLADQSELVELAPGITALAVNGGEETAVALLGPVMRQSVMVVDAVFPEPSGNLGLIARAAGPDIRYLASISPTVSEAALLRGAEIVVPPREIRALMDGQVHRISLRAPENALVLMIDEEETFLWEDFEPLPEGRSALAVSKGKVYILRVGLCAFPEAEPEPGAEIVLFADFANESSLELLRWLDEPHWELRDGALIMEIAPETGPAPGLLTADLPVTALVAGLPEAPVVAVTADLRFQPGPPSQGAGLALVGAGGLPLFTLTRAVCEGQGCAEGDAIYFQSWAGLRERLPENTFTAAAGALPTDEAITLRIEIHDAYVAGFYRYGDLDWQAIGEFPLTAAGETRLEGAGLIVTSFGRAVDPNKASFDNFTLSAQ
jgi:hypothetical protein